MARRIVFIIPWYRSADYATAVALFDELPGSYAAWRDRASHWEEQCRMAAMPSLRVLVRPDEFHAWCRASRCRPNAEARATFIIERAHSLLWPESPAAP